VDNNILVYILQQITLTKVIRPYIK